MIELPPLPAPTNFQLEQVDAGFFLRGAAASTILRVNRAGTHYLAQIDFPPMKIELARKFYTRIQIGKREGLRVEYPLLGISQGSPGSPVVDGSGQSGSSISVRNLTPYYVVKEGYGLNLVDQDDNRHLHFCRTAIAADASGDATISIEPALRAPFLDGAEVILAKPTIEGAVMEGGSQSFSVDHLVRFGASIMIEETTGLTL